MDNSKKEIPLKKHFLFLEDKENVFSGNDIGKVFFEEKFIKSRENEANFGYTSAVFWVKINLENQSDKNWLLEINNPNINEIEFFMTQNQQVISHFEAGDFHEIKTYPIQDRNPIFPLLIQKKQKYTIYLKGKSSEELSFKPTFWESNALYSHLSNRNLLWGIFFGFILVILFYNFFLWLTIRDKTYLFYIFYVLSFGLFQFSLYGFGFQYAWGNGIFNEKAHVFFLGLSVTFLGLFSIHFLDLFKIIPQYRRIFNIVGIAWLIIYLFMVVTFSHQTSLLLISVSIFGVIFQYYFSIKLWLKGNNSVRYYLLATIAFSVACLIVILKSFVSFFPGDFYLKLGSMVEMVLFSVALGEKYRYIKIEQIRQQKIREEIASNLHDDLAASLSSLTMYSESNRRKAQKENASNAEIFKKISEKSREILNQVRENVWEMNPRNDESDEWFDRMLKFANETLDSQQIDLELEIDTKISQQIIPIDTRHDLYLFFKEVINNIAKYSEANLVKIQIKYQNNLFEMMIEDNGKGFNINELQKGNGLLNLKKRAENINGKYKIESELSKGTKVYLSFRLPTTFSS